MIPYISSAIPHLYLHFELMMFAFAMLIVCIAHIGTKGGY